MPPAPDSGTDGALPTEGLALGLLETQGLVAAIEAADAMLKAARVRLVAQEKTDPALVTSKIVGETAAVRQAVDAGRAAAERVGKVLSSHVIPRPAADVWRFLIGEASAAPAPVVARRTGPGGPAPGAARPPRSLDAMTVRELRALARSRADDTFNGRAIARASKEQLLAFLRDRG
ncbi:MAG TPA: BMC domain-containing protein [Rubricoccaceae bacterium]|nr:BMC domain-containing protein [Rubricoccaceae bacterium]